MMGMLLSSSCLPGRDKRGGKAGLCSPTWQWGGLQAAPEGRLDGPQGGAEHLAGLHRAQNKPGLVQPDAQPLLGAG